MMDSFVLVTVAPTLGLFSLLWLLNTLVANSDASASRPRAAAGGSGAKTRNEFTVRAKPLEDTWRGKGEFRGWFTYVGVLIAATTVRVLYREYLESGRLFSVASAQYIFRVYIQETPEFLAVVTLQYLLCVCSFVLQKIMAVTRMGARSRLAVELVHSMLVAVLFTWSCMYASSRIQALSFSARFAIVTQGCVLCMKMHSYSATNRDLHRHARATAARNKKRDVQSSDAGAETQKEGLSFEEVQERLKQRGVEGRKVQGRLGDSEEEHSRRLLETFVELDEYRASVYPANVTLKNFVEFTSMPVLVYEPRYPRSSQVDVLYVLQKTAELVGLKVVGWLVLERSVIPVINDQTVALHAKVVELLVPVSLVFVVLFFIVFDCIFPALAEITRLADRGFYGDWWNSTSFADFSSSWNKPVHEFLLRHVHVASIEWLGFSRKYAAICTFAVSIVLHEVLITALLGRFRPYLAFFSVFQIPLWPIMRSAVFRNKLLGNAFFWTGLLLGITLVIVLYFSEYCASRLDRHCTIDSVCCAYH